MREIPLDDPAVSWAGAVSVERGEGWFRAWRIPYRQYDLFPPDGIGGHAVNSTGVRLALRSDTRSVEVRFAPMGQPAKLDLVCDGELVATADIVPGADRVRFADAPAGMKRVEVWLPIAPFRVVGLAVDDGARAEPFEDRRPRWTVYGSSITECAGAHSPARTWPAVIARRRDLNLTCLGFGGNCHAEPMVARLIRDRPADLISLNIGINIQGACSLSPRTFRPAVIGFVQIVREKQPDVPIVLASPIISPPRETTRNAVGLSLTDMRAQLAEVVETLVRHGAGPLYYLDGLRVMGEAERKYLPDDLHPSAEGYLVYADHYEREAFPLFARHVAALAVRSGRSQ